MSAALTHRAAAFAAAGIDASSPLIIDLDATLVTSHSQKEATPATFKRGYGFHPLCAFVDHGQDGTGELPHLLLRPGNAGSNTAADHITVTRKALAQIPGDRRGRKILIRSRMRPARPMLSWTGWPKGDCRTRWGSSSATSPTDALAKIPERVWTPADTSDAHIRDGAWVAELTGLLDLSAWPPGMRVIARKERPHPGAQLRLTDVDGHRITAFATNTRGGQLPDLELQHRRRARAEDGSATLRTPA